MQTLLALFRAVNVGARSASMAELRALFEAMGFAGAKTLLQTGNVVFAADAAPASLERRIEAAFQERFGFASDVMVRTAAEWSAALRANPFPDAARDDPSHLLLMPLKAAPTAEAAAGFLDDWAGPETGAVRGRDAFLVYPEGIGRSKLTIAVIERRLGTRGTGRNWNTALKLGALASQMDLGPAGVGASSAG